MSLEKLLIFGIALAVAGALTAVATRTATDRSTEAPTYKTNVQELVDKTKTP